MKTPAPANGRPVARSAREVRLEALEAYRVEIASRATSRAAAAAGQAPASAGGPVPALATASTNATAAGTAVTAAHEKLDDNPDPTALSHLSFPSFKPSLSPSYDDNHPNFGNNDNAFPSSSTVATAIALTGLPASQPPLPRKSRLSRASSPETPIHPPLRLLPPLPPPRQLSY
jgi:hypothetical protein